MRAIAPSPLAPGAARLACLIVAALAPAAPGEGPAAVGRDADRTSLVVHDVAAGSTRVARVDPRRLGAPGWSPDGASWIVNGGGQLWRLPTSGAGQPVPIAIPGGGVDVDHGVAPDGKTLGCTVAGHLCRVPLGGGPAGRVVERPGCYFGGWTPDGKTILFSSRRDGNLDLYAVPAAGGVERRLTAHRGQDDTPAASADGRWVYFTSDRAGHSDIWRLPLDGPGSPDDRAEPVTADDREDWSPHPSPDGKALAYLSYPPGTGTFEPDHEMTLRVAPLPPASGRADPKVVAGSGRELARFVGGHKSLGASPWSPDGRQVVVAAYDPPPPGLRIVFCTPSDLAEPPGVADRLTRVADAAEQFLVAGMKRQGYPPAVARFFARTPTGQVEIIRVRGATAATDPKNHDPAIHAEIIERAEAAGRVGGAGHLWWIFMYLGPAPTRFETWKGSGDSVAGGWAIVNYDSIPGEVRPDDFLSAGFNDKFALKGTIHELGHAFGLPHEGPDLGAGLGNSLMGPNKDAYVARKYSKPDQVYLTGASAAMLWRHPLLAGTTADRYFRPEGVRLVAFKPTYSRSADRITIVGKVASRPLPHSVILRDDLGRPRDDYWHRGHAARVDPDGSFKLAIERPAKVAGRYEVVFAFPNGMTTGDGLDYESGTRGAVAKSYRFQNGGFQFGD